MSDDGLAVIGYLFLFVFCAAVIAGDGNRDTEWHRMTKEEQQAKIDKHVANKRQQEKNEKFRKQVQKLQRKLDKAENRYQNLIQSRLAGQSINNIKVAVVQSQIEKLKAQIEAEENHYKEHNQILYADQEWKRKLAHGLGKAKEKLDPLARKTEEVAEKTLKNGVDVATKTGKIALEVAKRTGQNIKDIPKDVKRIADNARDKLYGWVPSSKDEDE